MSKINHTPGPWIVVKDERNFRAHIVTKFPIGEGKTIAEVPYFPRQRALFYNASLLSAAPELLSVLKTINNLISPEHFGEEIFERIQLAIDKATTSSK